MCFVHHKQARPVAAPGEAKRAGYRGASHSTEVITLMVAGEEMGAYRLRNVVPQRPFELIRQVLGGSRNEHFRIAVASEMPRDDLASYDGLSQSCGQNQQRPSRAVQIGGHLFERPHLVGAESVRGE